MTQKENTAKPSKTEKVEYTVIIATRETPDIKSRLQQLANRANKVLPDFMRDIHRRIIAEEDARLGGEG